MIGKNAEGKALIDKSEGRWTTRETAFRHRFQAFAELSNPSPLDYSDFLGALGLGSLNSQTAGAGKEVATRLAVAQGTVNCFQGARKLLDEARRGLGEGKGASGANEFAGDAIVGLTKVILVQNIVSVPLMYVL